MKALLSLAALLLLILIGCEKSAPSRPEVENITFALNWVPEPEFGGIYAARLIGAFAEEKLEVDIQGGGAGAPVIQRVAAGQVPYGIASADEVIMARARGADVVGIFAIYQTCPQGIMTHAARGLGSITDVFRSGTLAVEPGLPYVQFLKKRYGFDQVSVVPYDGGIARFMSQPDYAQQCFVTSEPIAARFAGADPHVFLVADSGYNPYTAVVITSGKYARERPEQIKSMVRALRKGWAAYLEDPAPANQFMGQLNRAMDERTFAAASEAQRPLIEAVPLGHMTAERWQTLGQQLAELKLIDAVPPAQDCFIDVGE